MKKENIKIIKDIICNELNLKDFDINKPILDLGADSLDLIDIIMIIEDRFNISKINDKDIYTIKTVRDLIQVTERYLYGDNIKI